MEWKKSPNPKIEALTKSETERQYPLSSVSVDKSTDTRLCVWCFVVPIKDGNQKYCSKECSTSMMAWGYPQKEEGLFFLLKRQDWKCNLCSYDYKPFIESHIFNPAIGRKLRGDFVKYRRILMKRLKRQIESALRPEVDHITPIYKGGVSLGLENHQALCFQCHKAKSKVDNSGPRKKKLTK